MFKFDKDEYGGMFISEYFMKQQRSQYAGEGYIVSITATFASFMFLLFARSENFFGEMSAISRLYLLTAILMLAYGAVETYIMIYRIKTPWYSSNFMPPHDYIRGPLQRD